MMCYGFEPRGGRLEGANESIELWRHSDLSRLLLLRGKSRPITTSTTAASQLV